MATKTDLLELERLLALEARRRDESKLLQYNPYLKQLEFHALGETKTERLLMAGNQQGKSFSGGMEVAMHLTGQYPDWWCGRRWDRPVIGWASGVTGNSVRDIVQAHLIGTPWPQGMGTGAIPKDCILDYSMSRGLADTVDTVLVRHVSGGVSQLAFKSYEQGREKWQGTTLDFIWYDEEPPKEIYTEGLARITATAGMVFMTFTPLKGMSEVVRTFLQEDNPDRAVVNMTIDDAEHLSETERQKIIQRYPEHEREARIRGIPMLGEGRVWPIAESLISCDPFEIPPHWSVIAGLDLGIDHPTAVVWLAWDKDTDTLYVTDCYRRSNASIAEHAAAVKLRTPLIPVAWPHDALRRVDDGTDGVAQIVQSYRKHGLKMLGEHATFPDGGNSVEAGVQEMKELMETGRFKVFRHLSDWFEEFRVYHRKDGKIVKLQDDLLSATRYAYMMRRHARPVRDIVNPGSRKKPRVAHGVDYQMFG